MKATSRDDLCIPCGNDFRSRRRRLKVADLAEAEWMLPGAGVGGRCRLEALFAAHGLPPPRVVIEVNNTAAQQ